MSNYTTFREEMRGGQLRFAHVWRSCLSSPEQRPGAGKEMPVRVTNLRESRLHTYTIPLYIYTSAAAVCEPRFRFAGKNQRAAMKFQRHNAIRDLVGRSLVANQDELRRKLRQRGFEVTQATLSRDIHELRLSRAQAAILCPTATETAIRLRRWKMMLLPLWRR